jgi:hypothetical protein
MEQMSLWDVLPRISASICPPSAVLSTLRSTATEDGRHLRLETLDFGLWTTAERTTGLLASALCSLPSALSRLPSAHEMRVFARRECWVPTVRGWVEQCRTTSD